MFATAGLTEGTTREIARVAVVNEVTLFCNFQNKEQLLAAVITEAMPTLKEASLSETLTRTPTAGYAYALQVEALAHHEDWTQNSYIDQPANCGANRLSSDIGLKASVDSFAGMLLHGILRFSDIPTTLEYSRECYMKTWVNLFVRGISTLPL
ncbi:TetR/AcrR family transcriptional regulator [Nostoc sp. UHCC 0251]|uniref:TetR/AcrR family transcriptional regulator n=1 Tax=Nostoc sp. UHCC 0251 TaxID=3110240 RepID=UPI003A4D8B47